MAACHKYQHYQDRKNIAQTCGVQVGDHSENPAIGNKIAIYIEENDGGRALLFSDRGQTQPLATLPELIEGDTQQVFFIVLNTEPSSPVYVSLTPNSDVYQLRSEAMTQLGDPGVALILTFSLSNWNIPQAVYMFATDDTTNRGDSYSGSLEFTSKSDDEYFQDSLLFVGLNQKGTSAQNFR